jgi:hypothetical protein
MIDTEVSDSCVVAFRTIGRITELILPIVSYSMHSSKNGIRKTL